MADFEHARRDVRPSVRAWFDEARNDATFANGGGTYDDLLVYTRRHKLT